MFKIIPLLLTIQLHATVHDIYSDDFLGKTVIESGDTIIVAPDNIILSKRIPFSIKVVVCRSKACRVEEVSRLKRLYRTNGIVINTIK